MCHRVILTLFLLASALSAVLCSQAGWSGAPNGQYHIQTDEGPERYFRYQTQSGQYRKEKRLQDGTVIGSYGWIDDIGYLRLRDYIADDAGYRILKSKTVFVGRNRPIEEAIKSTKKASPQAGILVKPGNTRPVTAQPPVRVAIAVTPAPSLNAYLPPSSTPTVLLSHNSIESSTEKPEYDFRPTVAPVAVSPFTQRPPAYYSSTESPIAADIASSTYLPPTSSPVYISSTTVSPPSSTYLPAIASSSYLPPINYEISSTPAPVVAITSNTLGDYRRRYQTYNSPNYDDDSLYSTKTLNLDPFSLQNTPIDRSDRYKYQRPRPYNRYTSSPVTYSGNNLGNGYDPQYPLYDGVSVTNNGFRYYLPRQYHEEENSGGSTRSGSFGYVDPFGIRRVIYYNTSPGSGFVHRKNNRYVGFDATPYDPRPL